MELNQRLPSLAVVVPTYNEAGTLATCLDNLLEQAADIAEIIIVDNNSTDGTLALAQSYAASYSRIRVIEERRQGLVPARNRGFLEAKSELVGRIDADTRVCPGWARAIRRHFGERPDVAALNGQTRYYDLPFERLSAAVSRLIVDKINGLIGRATFLYGPNMALRAADAKKLAKSACDEGGRLNEDLDLTLHLAESGRAIENEPAMLAYISGRRLKASPVKFIPYVMNWSRTYWLHRRQVAAGLALSLSAFYCLGQTLICLPLRAYDPKSLKFSWRRALESPEARIIP